MGNNEQNILKNKNDIYEPPSEIYSNQDYITMEKDHSYYKNKAHDNVQEQIYKNFKGKVSTINETGRENDTVYTNFKNTISDQEINTYKDEDLNSLEAYNKMSTLKLDP